MLQAKRLRHSTYARRAFKYHPYRSLQFSASLHVIVETVEGEMAQSERQLRMRGVNGKPLELILDY